MTKDIKSALPKVISDFVAAHNEHDPEKLIAAFASDALLNDVQREFSGHDSIRAWAADEIFGPKVTLGVEHAFDRHGDIILRCRVDGTFDKSNLPNPLILTYYFSLRNNKIAQLIILFNKAISKNLL